MTGSPAPPAQTDNQCEVLGLDLMPMLLNKSPVQLSDTERCGQLVV